MFKLLSFIVAALLLLFVYTTYSENPHFLSQEIDNQKQSFSQEHQFLLTNINGNQQSLDEYIGHGQWVVVNIWATACPFCREELFDLASFHDRHQDKDAVVLGLTLDLATFGFPDKAYLTKFAESYLIDYPLFLVSGDIANKVVGIPVNRVPMTLFYNPEGKLVYETNGMVDEETLEAVIKNKKIPYRPALEQNATHINNPNVK